MGIVYVMEVQLTGLADGLHVGGKRRIKNDPGFWLQELGSANNWDGKSWKRNRLRWKVEIENSVKISKWRCEVGNWIYVCEAQRRELHLRNVSVWDYPQSLVTSSHLFVQGFSDGSVVKNLPANEEDTRDSSSVSGSGRFPRRKWHPLQYSCLENPTDRGAWWVTVHGLTKSRTRLTPNQRAFWVHQDFNSYPPSSFSKWGSHLLASLFFSLAQTQCSTLSNIPTAVFSTL